MIFSTRYVLTLHVYARIKMDYLAYLDILIFQVIILYFFLYIYYLHYILYCCTRILFFCSLSYLIHHRKMSPNDFNAFFFLMITKPAIFALFFIPQRVFEAFKWVMCFEFIVIFWAFSAKFHCEWNVFRA